MKIFNSLKFNSHDTDFTYQEVEWPKELRWGKWEQVISIDPGNKNMGLCILQNMTSIIRCYEICLPSERRPIQRLVQTRLAMQTIFNAPDMIIENLNTLVCVEGSSFGSRFRNTELAEARITAAAYCLDNLQLTQNQFEFISPLKVRKLVFGSAKLRAEEQWPELKPDAASSVAVAIAGLMLRQE
jgi:Holliday junction resolvasome RuvABC endonuclease subunit